MSPSLDGTWAYTVLHTFLGGPGRYPGSLIFDGAGHLYGTTKSCGSRAKCMGIVFEITPQAGPCSWIPIDRSPLHSTIAGPEHKAFQRVRHSLCPPLHECQSKVRMTGRVSSNWAASRCKLEFKLLNRNQIEPARGLLVKQGTFFLISTTPVFVSSWYSQEVTRADALLARFVFV